MPTVAWLSVTPVKGLALVEADELELGLTGVVDNRRFWIVDADGRFYASLRDGCLLRVRPTYDADGERLSLSFPDGSVAEDAIRLGERIVTDFYGRDEPGRAVRGPWSDALSAFTGRPLRLVMGDRPAAGVDRVHGPVSLVSEASLEELARRAGRDGVDGRRFRMLMGVTGCAPHEEDEWCGREVAIGEAVVRVLEPVARCAITTRNPVSGERDLDTLRVIKDYRGLRDGDKIDFGVVGGVVRPGRIRVGDPVEPQ